MSDIFRVKTRIVHGEASLTYLQRLKRKSVWIICDQFLADSEGMKAVLEQIHASNEVSIFTDVVPDPPIEKVALGVMEAEKIQAEVMIAFGGGSAIDTAKGIYHFANVLGQSNIEKLIAIPTTSGTGSEVTSATVITDPSSKIKYPLFLDSLIPDVAILDPQLVVTVPPQITANTGMDVLTHAIEAYVSKKASYCSDALAEKSVSLTFTSLLDCFRDGANLEARDMMHYASTLAGMAFNCTNLGLNHSMAHQLGAQFGIPHGMANAILLPAVIRFNAKGSKRAKEKYARLARISEVASRKDAPDVAVERLCEKITSVMGMMGIPSSLQAAGVTKEQIRQAKSDIATNALQDSCLPTNPVQPSHEELLTMIEMIT